MDAFTTKLRYSDMEKDKVVKILHVTRSANISFLLHATCYELASSAGFSFR